MLEQLFEFKPENDYILIWTLPDKKSYWRQDPQAVKELVDEMPDGKDVYFGPGTAPAEFVESLSERKRTRRRCPQSDISAIVGLWVDIDVRGEGHKKENLPPTKKEAMKLIEEIPVEPSYIVDSGNGYQAWWRFHEAWKLEDSEEQKEARDLVKRWTYTIREIAQKKSWEVDATIDLSRVMRVPGTYNNKNDPKPVKIVRETGKAYSVGSFEKYLVDLSSDEFDYLENIEDGINPEVGKLQLKKRANPPFEKWEALQSAEPQVRRSWEHDRTDLNDQSASGYDMSLATYASMAKWSDQEIANLLIAHRRKHNENLKLDRKDYYERTIKKAKANSAKIKSQDELEIVAEKIEEANMDKSKDVKTEAENEKIREAVLKHISNMFGIEIIRFVKYTSDPPQYLLETSKGNSLIGGGSAVLRQSTFRSKIFEATNTVIPKFKGKKWDSVIQALGNCCVEESLGEEATDKGTAESWLVDYLDQRAVLEYDSDDEDLTKEIAQSKNPYKKDGIVYIFGSDFRRWLKVSQMEKISSKQMGTILRAYNCEPTKLNLTLDGSRTSRGVWELPDRF